MRREVLPSSSLSSCERMSVEDLSPLSHSVWLPALALQLGISAHPPDVPMFPFAVCERMEELSRIPRSTDISVAVTSSCPCPGLVLQSALPRPPLLLSLLLSVFPGLLSLVYPPSI